MRPAGSASRGLPPREAAGAALLAWLPFLVAFLLVPVSLFLPNQRDLSGDRRLLLPYCAVAAAALALLYARFRRAAPSARAVTIPFFLGVFLLLSDLVAPLQLGEFRDGFLDRPVPEPLGLSAREAALAIAVVLAARLAPWSALRRYAPPFVLILALVQIGTLGGELARSTGGAGPDARALAPPPPSPRPGGNVYQITFDAFSSWGFERLLRESGYAGDFEGFVFFEKNRSNYLYTWISRASYMTGSIFGGGRLGAWMDEWLSGGMIGDLRRAGFEIWQYISPPYRHRDASHLTADRDRSFGVSLPDSLHFADLWLLRLGPTFLGREIYRPESRGPFTALLRPWRGTTPLADLPARSLRLMERLIAEEAARPPTGQYVQAHLYLPHPPYVLDRDCRYVAEKTDRRQQSLCALKLAADFLRELKRRGSYDDATIILHSDHGRSEHGPQDPGVDGISPETLARMNEVDVQGGGALPLTRLSYSLLLVKPPRQRPVPVSVSDRIVQLADIPATVAALTGAEVAPRDGLPVLAPDFPEDREVGVYPGFTRTTREHREERFGTDFLAGEFNHFSYGRGGWKVHANIPVRW